MELSIFWFSLNVFEYLSQSPNIHFINSNREKMNASAFVLLPHSICFLSTNKKFSTFSAPSNCRLSHFPQQEITDKASSFTHRPCRSIRCEGNRRNRPRSNTSNDESPYSSNQEEIIALFRRIQSSISKDGGSTNSTRKQRSSHNPNERKAAESVLDVLRLSRKQSKENKVVPKRRVPKTRREVEDVSPTPEVNIVRPPSNFVKKSPIPRSSTFKEEIVEVKIEEEEEEEEEEESSGIEEMKVSELKELAKSRGLKGYSKLKKNELIELLRG